MRRQENLKLLLKLAAFIVKGLIGAKVNQPETALAHEAKCIIAVVKQSCGYYVPSKRCQNAPFAECKMRTKALSKIAAFALSDIQELMLCQSVTA
jgi:hypothetical protein